MKSIKLPPEAAEDTALLEHLAGGESYKVVKALYPDEGIEMEDMPITLLIGV